MCISTGFVPQWYMKTPGSVARNWNEKDLPGSTSRKATFGAMRAAWKSIECGIVPPFVSVILTSWPWRTCRIGPGAPWPLNDQVLYLTPGAIWTVMSFSVRWMFATGPAGAAGRVAS